jgi:hypothetical protein
LGDVVRISERSVFRCLTLFICGIWVVGIVGMEFCSTFTACR